MRKFYALIGCALLAAGSLSARELKFYEGDNEIASGSKVEYSKYTSETTRPGYVEITFKPAIYLWSDVTTSVTLTAKCITGHEIQLCTDQNCQIGKEVTKENLRLSADEKLDLQFEYISEQAESAEVPTVVTELTAFDPDRANVSADFTITFSPTSGVTEIFANDASFRAVAGGIEYSFESLTSVEIFSLSGESVLRADLNGAGLLSTSSLPAGIYAYKAGAKSGKIYIR